MVGSNRPILKIASYILLSLLAGMTVLPLVWMVVTSVKAPNEIFGFPPRWIPIEQVFVSLDGDEYPLYHYENREVVVLRYVENGAVVRAVDNAEEEIIPLTQGVLQPVEHVVFHWDNYVKAWKAINIREAFFGLLHNVDGFFIFYLNSIIVAVLVTTGQVFTSSLAAYAFARLYFRGRDQLFLAYLATLMVPAVVTMIPLFVLFRIFHLTDSYTALILPGIFSAYGTFMLRQFFLSLPRELEEAAIIDGANAWQIYWHIVLPLSKPALAALGIFVFLHSWNEFMWPLIVINSLSMKTLPIGLSYFQDFQTTEWHLLMAGSVIVLIPVLVVFLLGQRFFIKGIVLSGIKQ